MLLGYPIYDFLNLIYFDVPNAYTDRNQLQPDKYYFISEVKFHYN